MALLCYQRLFSCLFLVITSGYCTLSQSTCTIKPQIFDANGRFLTSKQNDLNLLQHSLLEMEPHIVDVHLNKIDFANDTEEVTGEAIIEAGASLCKNCTVNFDTSFFIRKDVAFAQVHYEKILRRTKPQPYRIHGPCDADETSRFIKLLLVIDNSLYRALNSNIQKITQRYKYIVKLLNFVYNKINIFVALVNIEIWTDFDKIHVHPDPKITIKEFNDYIRQLNAQDVDTAQLLTNVQFINNFVGWSTINAMCFPAVALNRDALDENNAIVQTLAHEIAHTMGINHDYESCSCSAEKCIMWPTITQSREWSNCTIKVLSEILSNEKKFSCLKNKPTRLFDGPVCGNGFTEPGEDCDCGMKEVCDNTCCNATTCTFHPDASCAFGECCDLRSCTIREAGTVCRLSSDDCDLSEYCDGVTEYCPVDVTKNAGEWCTEGAACDASNHQCKGNPILCLDDCHTHGICNSKGHCHCDGYYGPPNCIYPGFGGSIDSGPSRYPFGLFGLAYWNVIIIVVVPIVAIMVLLLLICIYCKITKRSYTLRV